MPTIVIVGCYAGGGDTFVSDGGHDAHADHAIKWLVEGGDDFPDSGSSFPSAFTPQFGATIVADKPPPAISGGTLLVTADGKFAVAADPDRDAIYGVDLGSKAVAYTVALAQGDEPGRLVEDGAGRVHVALRGGGALVTIDEATGNVIARRAVCPAPRGVGWDASTNLVWVACATGELVALPSAGGAATKSFVIERDLRDVIVDNGAIAVSELRSARVLRVAQNGIVTRRDDLLSPTPSFDAHVAWRAIAGPHGRIITLHQAESTDAIPTQIPGGYGSCGVMDPGPPPTNMPQLDGGAVANNATVCSDDSDGGVTLPCESGVVKSVLTVLASDGQAIVNRSFPAALPVDIAISRDGTNMAAVAPGNAFVTGLGTVFSFAPCGDIRRLPVTVGTQGSEQPIAVAFDASNDILVQTREPAELWIFDPTTTSASSISLSKISRKDTGHDIFSTQAGAMIACASCHPEGGDDGHTWLLDGKARRTPSLRGTIAGTAPYHWPGDEQNLDALVDDVYSKRMSGMPLMPDQKIALEGWVQTVPRPRAPSWIAPLAAQRGQSLFSSASIGCASCHSGDKLTNNASMDVGTGGVFQVPPLVGVGWRTPLFHDGCATTMADRFGKCATSAHGTTSALSAQDISDLTAYLETL